MEFGFSLNEITGDNIAVIDKNLTPFRNSPNGSQLCKNRLKEVINKMGEASAKAQNLHGPITSATKLEISDHKLYLMKDAETESVNGAAVGILKVGKKRLFVYDNNGGQHEMMPLCVLDFYVHESRQRTGCGRRLFDFMLQNEAIKPAHMAIDRPSHMFSSFLAKHYRLRATINQVNNFVIFEGFFRDRPPDSKRRGQKPPLHTYRKREVASGRNLSGRSTSGRLGSSQQGANTSDHQKDAIRELNVAIQSGSISPSSQITRSENPSSTKNLDGEFDNLKIDGLQGYYGGAQAKHYSRHNVGTSPTTKIEDYSNLNAAPLIEPFASPLMSSGNNSGKSQNSKDIEPPLLQRDGPSRQYKNLYKNLRSETAADQQSRNQCSSKDDRKLLYDKPSSSLLDRRAHQQQTENGILKKPSSTPLSSQTYGIIPDGIRKDFYVVHSAKPQNKDTSWTVFGVPPNYSGRKWEHTKLW